MPCNCDYMEPNSREVNSKETCENLRYTLRSLDLAIPQWITKAANDCYGNPDKLNEAVVMLCKLCGEMTKLQQDTIIYDGRSEDARKLADWWQKHQTADKKRELEDKKRREKVELKISALSKLTKEEKAALLE